MERALVKNSMVGLRMDKMGKVRRGLEEKGNHLILSSSPEVGGRWEKDLVPVVSEKKDCELCLALLTRSHICEYLHSCKVENKMLYGGMVNAVASIDRKLVWALLVLIHSYTNTHNLTQTHIKTQMQTKTKMHTNTHCVNVRYISLWLDAHNMCTVECGCSMERLNGINGHIQRDHPPSIQVVRESIRF